MIDSIEPIANERLVYDANVLAINGAAHSVSAHLTLLGPTRSYQGLVPA